MTISMNDMIEIGNSKFWIDNDILYCQFRNKEANYKLETSKIKRYIDAIAKLCNGKAMPFLIDSRDTRVTYTRETANLLANSPILRKLRISEAFVFNSMEIKLVIASYKRIYEPITPFGVFNNIESAREYCVETKNNFYGSN